jgi:hypothetical protein
LRIHEKERERCRGGTTPEDDDTLPDQSCSKGPKAEFFGAAIDRKLTCERSQNSSPIDASQGAGHANHTHGNGAEFAQDPLSLPSGPITRLRAKHFKEALNGLIRENGVDSKKTKMGPNNDQGLVHVIKAIDEFN